MKFDFRLLLCVSLLMDVVSFNNKENTALAIGQCDDLTKTQNLSVIGRNSDQIVLLDAKTGLVFCIGTITKETIKKTWENYKVLDNKYKILPFEIDNKTFNGIVREDKSKTGMTRWIYIPVLPDTYIRVDYPVNTNESQCQLITERFLASVKLKPGALSMAGDKAK